MKIGLLASAAALAFAALPASAATTLLTSESGYAGPGLDLSAFANGQYNFTFGPINVDTYIFTAAPGGGGNSGQGSVVGQGNYGLGGNGSFGGDAIYIGVDSGSGYAQLVLSSPVSQLGFFMNYLPGSTNPPVIEALDVDGNPFASYDLSALAPISTPGGFNEFAFRGISSDATDIYGLRFGGSYILLTGTADGTPPPPSPIPEPGSFFALGGLLSLGLVQRSRRKQA